MTDLFSKSFTFLLYHHWEIQPDSADSRGTLWSGAWCITLSSLWFRGLHHLFSGECAYVKGSFGNATFLPIHAQKPKGMKSKRDERQLYKCKFVMHLGEGPFINVTLELQVVVCFGQVSNGLRIILHLVLQSLFNKFVQDVHFIRREVPRQLLAYCI